MDIKLLLVFLRRQNHLLDLDEVIDAVCEECVGRFALIDRILKLNLFLLLLHDRFEPDVFLVQFLSLDHFFLELLDVLLASLAAVGSRYAILSEALLLSCL